MVIETAVVEFVAEVPDAAEVPDIAVDFTTAFVVIFSV